MLLTNPKDLLGSGPCQCILMNDSSVSNKTHWQTLYVIALTSFRTVLLRLKAGVQCRDILNA